MVKNLKKADIVMTPAVILVVLLTFVLIVTLVFIPRIIKPTKIITDLVELQSLDEENMYEYIKGFIRQNDFDKAYQILQEYFSRYDEPSNQRIHEMHYIRLKVLLDLHKYDEAIEHIILYNRSYPLVINSFDKTVNDVTEFFFWYSNELTQEQINSENLLERLSDKFILPYDYLSGILYWPNLPEKMDKSILINPLFFHWYNYIKLTKEIHGCQHQIINDSFQEVFECYTGSLNNAGVCKDVRSTHIIDFFNEVKKLCNDTYLKLAVDSIDADIAKSPFPYEVVNNKENFYISSNLLVKTAYLSREYSILDSIKLYRSRGSKPSSLTSNLAGRLSLNVMSNTDMNYLALHYQGVLYFENANKILSSSCKANTRQVSALFDLFNLDGDLNKLRDNMKVTNAWFDRNKKLGDCFTIDAKNYYRKAYDSFKKAYELTNSTDFIKYDYDAGNNTWLVLEINSDERYNAKKFIYPYYLQASFVNEFLNGDSINFPITKDILSQDIANENFYSWPFPFSYNFDYNGFSLYFNKIFINYICTTPRTNFDFSQANYYFICYTSANGNQPFNPKMMVEKLRIKIGA
jgi:hypothetical protein